MITGGVEAVINPTCIAGFNSMKALSTRNDAPQKASRPFEHDRDGFVVGEGSGILIIETLEHALDRGAKIYAELTGYGMSSDGYHMTAPPPDGSGAVNCMKAALDDAEFSYDKIDYINAHGTSTPLNDLVETLAIKTVFQDHDGRLPPTINHDHADKECDLDYVPNVMRKASVEHAMTNSFGFGGTNASLILSRYRN
jgi:3-oxoacyl-[acyl-carrier-protein] synthase II